MKGRKKIKKFIALGLGWDEIEWYVQISNNIKCYIKRNPFESILINELFMIIWRICDFLNINKSNKIYSSYSTLLEKK